MSHKRRHCRHRRHRRHLAPPEAHTSPVGNYNTRFHRLRPLLGSVLDRQTSRTVSLGKTEFSGKATHQPAPASMPGPKLQPVVGMRLLRRCLRGVLLAFRRWHHVYTLPVFANLAKLNRSVNQCKERIVPPHADIAAGMELRAVLPNKDVSGYHALSAEFLEAKPL